MCLFSKVTEIMLAGSLVLPGSPWLFVKQNVMLQVVRSLLVLIDDAGFVLMYKSPVVDATSTGWEAGLEGLGKSTQGSISQNSS